MIERTLYRKVLTTTFVLLGAALLCRMSNGYFSIAMVCAGIYWAATRQYGKALSCYGYFPFLAVVNPYIVPKPSIMGMSLRIGPLLIGMVLFLVAMNREGRHRLPLGTLFAYLLCVSISSSTGWSPKVSYFKLINFVFFVLGFWIGTQNLQNHPKELEFVRVFILSMALITVAGSLCTLPFPGIAYPLDLQMASVFRKEGLEGATAYFQSQGGGMTLFAGITFHSQTLGPLLSCLFTLVLADMIFIERRMTFLHISLLGTIPVLLFMTRSRTALLSFAVGSVLILTYAASHVSVSPNFRRRINQLVKIGVFALIALAAVAEVSNRSVTRWIRKTDEVSSDNRSLAEAVTSTRLGLIDMGLDEFKRNPVFGMGFQVNFESQILYGNKEWLILSAPVEKGLLPIVVLGEGGIVGSIVFLIFLISFYLTCLRRKYVITIAAFTTFIATNFGEATFFSPGGGGGIEWFLTAVGGFCMDTILLYWKRLDVQLAMAEYSRR